MWQAIYPNSYIPSSGAWNQSPSYGIPSGTVYPTTPLRPFSRTANQYWDSNTARWIGNFGYSYPEINDWNRTPEQLRNDVWGAVNARYGPSTFFTKRDGNDTAPAPYRSWKATVSVRNSVSPENFAVILFLGEPPANSDDWLTADNLVAMLPVLMPKTRPGAARMSGTTNNEFTLDEALDKAGIIDRSAEVVEPYLAENLTWRIREVSNAPELSFKYMLTGSSLMAM